MAYILTDLRHFEFHDSNWTLLSHDPTARTLTVACEHLNLHKDALPEPLAWDMELVNARITFTGFGAYSFEPSRVVRQNADGEWVCDELLVVYEGEDARRVGLSELTADGIVVYDLEIIEREDSVPLCLLDGRGDDPFFRFTFSFETATVEWDDFGCPAWYERDADGHAP